MSELRVLVADDEPLVRHGLKTFLEGAAGLRLVGEARHGAEAIAMIRSLAPDLVFLDVQMPEVDGFGVLEALGSAQPRAVVFVTAFDRYAIRAFDVHAVDYLLKPFDEERFRVAVERARARLTADGRSPDWRGAAKDLRERRKSPTVSSLGTTAASASCRWMTSTGSKPRTTTSASMRAARSISCASR